MKSVLSLPLSVGKDRCPNGACCGVALECMDRLNKIEDTDEERG
jgi:hypothetical protein